MSVEPRLSFGRVVDTYERARPQYAPEAVEWIAATLPMRPVLDLGAGTGKLTRQLVPLAETVVAVEPDDDMRAMLERAVPGVDSLAGSAEGRASGMPIMSASTSCSSVSRR